MTPKTLAKERRMKFIALIVDFIQNSPAITDVTGDEMVLDSEIVKFAHRLAEAAQSRTEAQQEEVITQADRKVDAILDLSAQAKTAEDAGQAWRGREFLTGSEYCKYGDWWYKKTGLEMYGAKGKAKINTEWMKAFKEWHEFGVTIQTLDETFQSESWRPIVKPSQITATAKAIQAAPPVVADTKPAQVYTPPADEPEYVPAPPRKP